MGTYEDLKAAIQQVIRTNGNNEITGALLQQTLLSIVNSVGTNAAFAGIATPDTNPGTVDQNVFYLATEAGTYVNFGNIEINEGEAVILSNKTGNWVKTLSGFSTKEQNAEMGLRINKISDSSYLVKSWENFESGTLSETGKEVAAQSRWRSDFLSLPKFQETLAQLRIEKTDGFGIYLYWYDMTKTFLSYVTYIESGVLVTPPSNAAYCRIIVYPTPEVSVFSSSLLATFTLAIRANDADTINILKTLSGFSTQVKQANRTDLFKTQWQIGSYYDNIVSVRSRRFIVLPTRLGNRYIINKPSTAWHGYIYFADSDGVIDYINIRSGDIFISEINGRIPNEMRITVVPNPDANITDDLWQTFDISCYDVTSIPLSRLKVAEWNFGLFNNGITPIGIDNSMINELLPKIKTLLTNLNADILLATEYVRAIDRNGTINTYNEVLKQFYPFRYYGGNYMAIFSKYPFSVKSVTSPNGGNTELGIININGNIIGLGLIHPRSASGEDAENERIADHEAVIEYFANYERVIVGGDFNTYEDRELDVYRNAGWNLGNCGYFGNIDTYMPSSRPWYIDNIVTKGINLDNFIKLDDRADVSDHYPVIATISFL